MTIKRYSISIGYGEVPGDVEVSMEESLRGDYLKVADLKQQLDDLLFNNINEACDIMSFLYKLHEELQ